MNFILVALVLLIRLIASRQLKSHKLVKKSDTPFIFEKYLSK